MAEPVVEPMGEGFLVWRCLHQGPLSPRNIGSPAPNPDVDWAFIRARNLPLLQKFTATYGACAILAREGSRVVGSLRFYPKALCSFGENGAGFCLQQRAYEELPTLYAISGVAGRRFWEPLGFRVLRKDHEPGIQGDILKVLRAEAASAGLAPDDVTNRYAMRLELR